MIEPRLHAPEFQEIGARLAESRGPDLWRTLEELADTEDFRRALHREFPERASEWTDAPSRREFLRLMAASFTLAGLTACSNSPSEEIAPPAANPERGAPGKPLFFATALTLGGVALGALAETHSGRPTKIEGNPDHPTSLGATDAFTQAQILSLYDPDRARAVTDGGGISTWEAFAAELADRLEELKAARGRGLRLLTGPVTSPTLGAEMMSLLRLYPEARWSQFDPAGRDNIAEGARLAFGKTMNPLFRFDKADVVLSLDADFLNGPPASVRHARDFASRRSVRPAAEPGAIPAMTRLYAVEPTPTTTGMCADHRLPLRVDQIEALVRVLALRLGVDAVGPEPAASAHGVDELWLGELINDLRNHRPSGGAGSALVVAGPALSPESHAIVFAVNHKLGAIGRTLDFTRPLYEGQGPSFQALAELTREMDAGLVNIFVRIETNPSYAAPGDLAFDAALEKVPFRVCMSPARDETSVKGHWHLPLAHELESWGDARGHDGTATIIQPVIEPLHRARSPLELIALLRGEPTAKPMDAVRGHWKRELGEAGFEAAWSEALRTGVVPGTAFAIEPIGAPRADYAAEEPEPPRPDLVDLHFRPDPTIWDGTFSNNAWLQELPKPLLKLTWENAATVAPAMARRMGLANGDLVEIRRGQQIARAPVMIAPGQADGVVGLTLGYGRTRAGLVGNGLGYNASPLRRTANPWIGRASLGKTGERSEPAITQTHQLMEGRELVLRGSLAEVIDNPGRPRFMTSHSDEPTTSLYPDHSYEGHKWAMAIDLSKCVGCSSCVVACQAENNIPVVGRDQVRNGREMHWLRIDNYYEGSPDNPTAHHQPVPCMHCEAAPCEVVCPVAATTHSDEGLNEMTYNRCVGTRYCSNNCPYKVRRFNFLEYSRTGDPKTAALAELRQNPDVTVRTRGVMEKCTYCVQRIQAGKIQASVEGRALVDGEIQTACQAACATGAIVFGDLNGGKSAVASMRREPTNYALLAHLNTRPRTTYLASVRNPNPRLREAGL